MFMISLTVLCSSSSLLHVQISIVLMHFLVDSFMFSLSIFVFEHLSSLSVRLQVVIFHTFSLHTHFSTTHVKYFPLCVLFPCFHILFTCSRPVCRYRYCFSLSIDGLSLFINTSCISFFIWRKLCTRLFSVMLCCFLLSNLFDINLIDVVHNDVIALFFLPLQQTL